MTKRQKTFLELGSLILFMGALIFSGCAKSAPSDPSTSGTDVGCRIQAPATITTKTALAAKGPFLDEPPATPSKPRRRMRKLHGHLPGAARKAADLGKMDETRELPITVALDLNNSDELAQKLREMYRPGSPTFHKFLKPEEFGGKTSFAPAFELQTPEELSIHSIHGLHDFTKRRTHLRPAAQVDPSRAGSGVGGGFTPADVRLAYNVPVTAVGAGQTLAVFELDGYTASDVDAYESAFGLPAVPLQNILIDGATGAAGSDAGEVTLDIELMAAIAPSAQKILVYESINTDQGVLDGYARIASDNIAQTVSTSWGSSEEESTPAFLESENAIFLQMAAQGQTVYAAAGDAGAYDDGSTLSVDDPASQPYVVAVGGTRLTTNATGHYGHETSWNTGSSATGAGGGGISAAWSIPSWQSGIATATNTASTTMRNVPDVALNADANTGYAIYVNGGWHTYGGTSCAAPLWAAFTALVNEQRDAKGLAPIGYVNPLLYQIGQSKQYAANFFDIADKSTNLYYPAVTGFDNATGWGSFNGAGLLATLANDTVSEVEAHSNFVGTLVCP
ncbi:MAG: hypothetical protein HY074_06525 [Deltaproteobacteria bacterium]|nr:hypothetical protein [Deltaproteobacteria bacterium]